MFKDNFKLTKSNINSLPKDDWYNYPTAGAAVTFEGRVRNHNDGKNVSFLEYQTYEEMAHKVGNLVVLEAKEKFNIIDLLCIHRHGKLEVGDIAVWVVALSAHRKESFLACEYIIDEIKSRLPMWKKEFYHDLSPVWVACHACHNDKNDFNE